MKQLMPTMRRRVSLLEGAGAAVGRHDDMARRGRRRAPCATTGAVAVAERQRRAVLVERRAEAGGGARQAEREA